MSRPEEKLGLTDMEDEIHDAIYMMRVLDERISHLMGSGDPVRLRREDADLTLFLSGQALDKAKAVLARWNEIFASNGGQA